MDLTDLSIVILLEHTLRQSFENRCGIPGGIGDLHVVLEHWPVAWLHAVLHVVRDEAHWDARTSVALPAHAFERLCTRYQRKNNPMFWEGIAHRCSIIFIHSV